MPKRRTRYNELSAQIKAAEQRLAEISVLKTQFVNYAKTRETYVAYRKDGYSKKFLVPTVKSLQAEYATLLAEKKAAYADYRKARDEMKEPIDRQG